MCHLILCQWKLLDIECLHQGRRCYTFILSCNCSSNTDSVSSVQYFNNTKDIKKIFYTFCLYNHLIYCESIKEWVFTTAHCFKPLSRPSPFLNLDLEHNAALLFVNNMTCHCKKKNNTVTRDEFFRQIFQYLSMGTTMPLEPLEPAGIFFQRQCFFRISSFFFNNSQMQDTKQKVSNKHEKYKSRSEPPGQLV